MYTENLGRSDFSISPRTDPLVSVIIPTHKRAPKLAATIAAINDQRYDNIELILVCTPDNETERILHSVSHFDMEIKPILRNTSGASEARNIGIDEASGDILAFTDDDCLPPRDWVSGIVSVFDWYDVITAGGMNLPHARVESRWAARIDTARLQRNQLPTALERDENGVATGGIELRTFGTSNVAYAADAIEEASVRFNTELARGEDADFQRRVLDGTAGMNAYLPIPVWHNRDYTLIEFLQQRYHNGKSEAITQYGRTIHGSAIGLVTAPALLCLALLREESKTVAVGSWLGDVTARIGVLRNSLKR